MKRRRKICQSHCSAKYRSKSPGQRTCQVSILSRSTMQGLVLVSLVFEEISNVDIKCVKVTGVQNIGQGHRVEEHAKSVY